MVGDPFRDEHAALIERIARLEDDLATARGGGAKHEDIARELDELTKRVAVALERADSDRNALHDVSQALERVRHKVAPRAEAPSAASDEPKGPGTQTSPRVLWIAVAAVALGSMLVPLVLLSRPAPPTPPVVETPATLDPSAVIEEARKRALDKGLPTTGQLVRIKVRYTSSDGLVHLHEPTYEASVELVFATPVEAPKASPSAPLGVPAAATLENQTEITVVFDRGGVRVTDTSTFFRDRTVPNPRCRVADIWKVALAHGAPAHAVATVTYEDSFIASGLYLEQKPHWQFEIAETNYKYDVSDTDCTLMPHG